jgi:hypothetical protein
MTTTPSEDSDLHRFDRDIPPDPEWPPEPDFGKTRIRALRTQFPQSGPDAHRTALLWLAESALHRLMEAADVVADPHAQPSVLLGAQKTLRRVVADVLGRRPETIAAQHLVQSVRDAAASVVEGMDLEHAVVLAFDSWDLHWPGYSSRLTFDAKARVVEAWVAARSGDGRASCWEEVKTLFELAGLPAPASLDRLTRRWLREG